MGLHGTCNTRVLFSPLFGLAKQKCYGLLMVCEEREFVLGRMSWSGRRLEGNLSYDCDVTRSEKARVVTLSRVMRS